MQLTRNNDGEEKKKCSMLNKYSTDSITKHFSIFLSLKILMHFYRQLADIFVKCLMEIDKNLQDLFLTV